MLTTSNGLIVKPRKFKAEVTLNKDVSLPESINETVRAVLYRYYDCAHEIIDNAVDEFVTGFGKCITVEYNPDTQVMIITDEGRGIPVALNEKYKIPQVQLALGSLHAGG